MRRQPLAVPWCPRWQTSAGADGCLCAQIKTASGAFLGSVCPFCKASDFNVEVSLARFTPAAGVVLGRCRRVCSVCPAVSAVSNRSRTKPSLACLRLEKVKRSLRVLSAKPQGLQIRAENGHEGKRELSAKSCPIRKLWKGTEDFGNYCALTSH